MTSLRPSTTKVLLIDDDESSYESLRLLLESPSTWPTIVEWAPSYEAGLEALRSGRHHVALVDVDLREPRTGIDLTRQASSEGCPTPIVVFTGMVSVAVETEALAAGATDYLVKGGVSNASLHRALRQAVDRNRATIALRESRVRLAAILDSVEDAIVGADVEGRIREWSPGAERVYGCAAAQALGRDITDFVVPDGMEQWSHAHRRMLLGERIAPMATERRRLDGTTFDANLTLTALRDASGAVVGSCTVTRDVSETKALRARLATADRMASVGTLAAGVAHEINNPLAAIMANLEHVLEDMARTGVGPPDASDALQDALCAAGRIRDIVRGLKLFSRPEEETSGPVDVRRTLEGTLKMVATEIRHRARLVQDLEEGATVEGTETRVGQVLLNLLVNAAQAIPEGDASHNEIRVTTRVVGSRVSIEVADTGCGIPAGKVARIFEPFYTTKSIGGGMGLGLSICHGIVTKLGGEILVESHEGQGSRFVVWLPSAASRTLERDATPPPITRHLRILVVDDDPVVAAAVVARLRRRYEVVAVTDARDAVARLERGEAYDVILSDVMMPEMSGPAFYEEVRQRAPAALSRIVFVTGGAFTPQAAAFLERIPNSKLDKPIDFGKLERIVARIAAGARSSR